MTEPVEGTLSNSRGSFRTLTWGDGDETVLLLHGLSGVAEVWWPTVEALPPGRRYVAIDQRGHGQTQAAGASFTASAMAEDIVAALPALGVPVHLVGHSMGGRVAIVVAAKYPALLRSVSIADIGPEESAKNIRETVAGIASRPERFENKQAALAFAFRSRTPTELDERIFLARLRTDPAGGYSWRATRDDLTACVVAQRRRGYWAEWRQLRGLALFIHGGKSAEVSHSIADRMRRENPTVAFERFDDVGHNIPLIAPARLADVLNRHWTAASKSAT